ncbi:MAG: sigma-E processing peptidase SpoIIGA [Lachnospiraceae bacterium]|nr:sigma-E processing peptidase SpoIIGA [Lachnospiraceae bacterium]
MYYKLYIDSVFFIQFVMNLYLLSITGKVLKCTATHRRILLGALFGAGMICLVILLPIGTIKIRLICGILPVSMCMMRMVFGIRTLEMLLKSSLLMGMCGFFFGSIVTWLDGRVVGKIFYGAKTGYNIWSVFFYGYVGYSILKFLIHRMEKGKKNDIREVHVPLKEKKVEMKALVDTGNHLADPVSGAPVCIVSEKAARLLQNDFLPEHFHAIPYRSVGKQSGVLEAYELPELIIEDTYREIHRKKVIVAICNAGISEDSIYQMILHPQLLED